MVREIQASELDALLQLYTFLHEDGMPAVTDTLLETWQRILQDANHHILVYEVEGKLVSSCVCVLIPNLTRQGRPYALIENVVTHGAHRGKGYATACLQYAKAIAEKAGCYKMMLLTGSKQQATLDFYRKAGYTSEDKTAFVQWLPKRDAMA